MKHYKSKLTTIDDAIEFTDSELKKVEELIEEWYSHIKNYVYMGDVYQIKKRKKKLEFDFLKLRIGLVSFQRTENDRRDIHRYQRK